MKKLLFYLFAIFLFFCTTHFAQAQGCVPPPTNGTPVCSMQYPVKQIFDFEGFPAGTVMSNQYSSVGKISVDSFGLPFHLAVIFDSANPTGGDLDLQTPGYGIDNTTPLGNLLIIAQTNTDANKDGLIDDPNDSNSGGQFITEFDEDTSLKSVDLIDLEDQETGIILGLDKNGAAIYNICFPPAKDDNSVIRVHLPSHAIRKLIVHLDSPGSIAVDNFITCQCEPDDCGVCGGDNQSKDACGICPGQPGYNTGSCLDCKGIPNGPNKPGECGCDGAKDLCGLCSGHPDFGKNLCFDCKGIPFGPNDIDECNVCGGTGRDECGLCPDSPDFGEKKCFDCNGTFGGPLTLDQCGVCGGDGRSCLGCNDVNISEAQFLLDGGANEMRNLVKQAGVHLRKISRDADTLQLTRTSVKKAVAIFNKTWAVIWSLPQVISNCTNTIFCFQTSNETVLSTYTKNSKSPIKLIRRMIRHAKGKNASRKQLRPLRRDLQEAKLLRDIGAELTAGIPLTASVCSS